MTDPIISLRQIKKTYNDKTVLHDIHLNLYQVNSWHWSA